MGGADKAGVLVGGRSLLERSLDAVGAAGIVVVVGPERAATRPVTWARESPPGGGPVAAIAEGLDHVRADLVAVVAVDLPLLDAEHLASLERAATDHDGAVLVDGEGVVQPLAGVYRVAALSAGVARLPSPSGASARELIEDLRLVEVCEPAATRDCDTQADIAAIEGELIRR
jgi:molybdopterin-guanine dinucleotide biosynthesis protein A